MPENWDPAVYWDRAKQWRERAASLPEDHPKRAIWLQIAEGYEKLAALLEQRERLDAPRLREIKEGGKHGVGRRCC